MALGLGSNRGDSPRILVESMGALARGGLGEIRQAPVYKTEPVGVRDQPWFFNTVVTGRFSGSPGALLEQVQRIEAAFGRDRRRERRWGERPLDIDILLFGDRVVAESPRLVIPHPRLQERAFALIPLLDLLPDAVDPRSKRPYREFLETLGDRGGVVIPV